MGEFYHEWDEDLELWAVLNTEGSFCFALYCDEIDAREDAGERNDRS